MERLIDKFDRKLVAAGLVDKGAALFGFLDADIEWNRSHPAQSVLSKIFDGMSINSLLFAPPREPYASIIDYLARTNPGAIHPKDCETRTFIHDLPVIEEFSAEAILPILRRRKSVIVRGHGIVTFGTVSPEWAFIVFSSVCFSSFVKFFSDYLRDAKTGELDDERRCLLKKILPFLDPVHTAAEVSLMRAPFVDGDGVVAALDEAGKKTVDLHLVDSFFGNISLRQGQTIYISQTTSSLDELVGAIDPCPLDGSSCAGVTASSELTAHRGIITGTGSAAVLHGHPKFSVIMSMECDVDGCDLEGECHRRCPHPRSVAGVPVVSGEVGTGRFGLCNTVPQAMQTSTAVIVYGHGVFAIGERDFTDAFPRLLAVENDCRAEYFRRLREYGESV